MRGAKIAISTTRTTNIDPIKPFGLNSFFKFFILTLSLGRKMDIADQQVNL